MSSVNTDTVGCGASHARFQAIDTSAPHEPHAWGGATSLDILPQAVLALALFPQVLLPREFDQQARDLFALAFLDVVS